MHRIAIMAATLSMLASGLCFGQEWVEYSSQADYFSVNFPTEPKINPITYMTEYGLLLPGRVYSATEGANRYSVTVIDYTEAERLHTDKSKKCIASGAYPDVCTDHGRLELRGAIDFATSSFLKREAKVTFFAYYDLDLVEGRQLQLTNTDGSRTFAAINMHDNRLYILDGTVPKGAPQPLLFQQSMGFIDKEGKRIRYESIYSNAYPAPRRSR